MPLLLAGATVLVAASLMGLFASKVRYPGKHVVITGGSTGIGLCLAKEFVSRGAAVTLIARTTSKLQAAQAELEAIIGRQSSHQGQVLIKAADTTQPQELANTIQHAETAFGPVDVLVCNAGASVPARFDDTDLATFRRLVDLNYMGTVHTLKAVLPGMAKRRRGQVVMIASAAAICSFAGFSSYAPTKWAVRGLGDCLRNEQLLCCCVSPVSSHTNTLQYQGTGITFSIGYPPDTATPGYEEENKTKSKECKEISKAVGSVYKPEQVAKSLMRGIERKLYHLPSPDVVQNLLMDNMASLSPRYLPVIVSCLIQPIVVLILCVVRLICDRIVIKVRKQEQ